MDGLRTFLGMKRKGLKSVPSSALTLVRYIYLDVVGFTHKRSVEVQVDIINALNGIVRDAVDQNLPRDSVIYIPVGDGICIALFGKGVNYDSHICIALDILARIYAHNQSVKGMCKFNVRIGINQNEDNIIKDINGNINVVGAGVNLTQRIMSFADGNQILVSRSVYDTLDCRQKYMGKFRPYIAQAKHGVRLDLFQYIDETITELNKNVPSAFVAKEPILSKVAAYYFAHCLKNKKFILKKRGSGQNNYALRLLLWYLARDSVGESQSTLANPYDKEIIETEHGTLDEQFDKFNELPFWVCCYHGHLALEKDIGPRYHVYFEDEHEGLIVNDLGKNKLKSKWPRVWEEFGLDNVD
jgi:class 3 adenylate cyclase